jgi:hypothetical protein
MSDAKPSYNHGFTQESGLSQNLYFYMCELPNIVWIKTLVILKRLLQPNEFEALETVIKLLREAGRRFSQSELTSLSFCAASISSPK